MSSEPTDEMVQAAWQYLWSQKRWGLPDVKEALRPAVAEAFAEGRAQGMEEAAVALERARTVLGNMALENESAWWPSTRWPINHEPLRSDARNILPIIDEALTAIRAAKDSDDAGG